MSSYNRFSLKGLLLLVITLGALAKPLADPKVGGVQCGPRTCSNGDVKHAVTKAAASALLLVESVRNNFANQFAPPHNVVRQNALLARNAAIPVVEYALLLAGFVLSNFAKPLRLRSKLEATQFDHVLECLLLRI
ncbi:hypothetical protein GX50_01650 [[Emmonsia] crescens]|uniref:Uncharacterized protein n=1 Tax=[Emmonsia] crescens TaxID=73230 RepID=A0A2B7ZQT4_9EURO|nr:hypothetical protein GX50_01650 [Emmonsia crescens]